MVEILKVPFPDDEFEALRKLAREEIRAVHEEVRFLVVQELKRRGLLHDGDAGAPPCTPLT